MELRVKKCSKLVPAIGIYRTPDASKSQLSTFVPNHTHSHTVGDFKEVRNVQWCLGQTHYESIHTKIAPLTTPQVDNIQAAMAAIGAIRARRVGHLMYCDSEGGHSQIPQQG